MPIGSEGGDGTFLNLAAVIGSGDHGPFSPICASFGAAATAVVLLAGGCTRLSTYISNGFKVGPNYAPPGAMVAEQWIDAADIRVRGDSPELGRWWQVFRDPILDSLVAEAARQNLTLREAGFRILQARAQADISVGRVFPQLQDASGGFRHTQTVGGGATRSFDQWDLGFRLAWELDFWGRFRAPWRPPMRNWMPPWRTTTTCWLPCWATSP